MHPRALVRRMVARPNVFAGASLVVLLLAGATFSMWPVHHAWKDTAPTSVELLDWRTARFTFDWQTGHQAVDILKDCPDFEYRVRLHQSSDGTALALQYRDKRTARRFFSENTHTYCLLRGSLPTDFFSFDATLESPLDPSTPLRQPAGKNPPAAA